MSVRHYRATFLQRFRSILRPLVRQCPVFSHPRHATTKAYSSNLLQQHVNVEDPSGAALLSSRIRVKLNRYRAVLATLGDGAFVGDHLDKFDYKYPPSGPNHTIWTLRLDEGIRTNQWFRISPTYSTTERPGLRARIHGKAHYGYEDLGRYDIWVNGDLRPEGFEGELWVCPYWNAEAGAVCFRIHGTEGIDLGCKIGLRTIGNKSFRALGRLASKQGLLEPGSYTDTRYAAKSAAENVWSERYKRAQAAGYGASLKQFLSESPGATKIRQIQGKKMAVNSTTTLVRDKALLLPPAWKPLLSRAGPTANGRILSYRTLWIGGELVGRVLYRLPGSFRQQYQEVRVYFHPESRSLRAFSEKGIDIPDWNISWNALTLSDNYRPLLRLAAAEGLIERAPEVPYPTSFNLKRSMESGYMVRPWSKPRYERTVPVRTPNAGAAEAIYFYRGEPLKGVTTFVVPYIDDEGMFRLWDIKEGKNLLLHKTRSHPLDSAMSGEEVKKLYPRLFAHAQSLGHWKHIPAK